MTRGLKNNNPGNIRIAHGTTWQGQAQVQTDPSFVVFAAPEWGIRAIVRIMRSYKRANIDTLDAAINRWAPPNENNSVAYVDAVCEDCQVNPYDHIDLDTIMPQLVKAIIRHENGVQPYSDSLIAQGISLA